MSFRRLLLLILAGLLIAEGVGQLYYARKHAAKRQEAEAVSFLHSSREFVEYKNKEYRVAKDPGTYRILVLGGSAAAGFGGQYEKSWAPILEQLLNEAPPSPGNLRRSARSRGPSRRWRSTNAPGSFAWPPSSRCFSS